MDLDTILYWLSEIMGYFQRVLTGEVPIPAMPAVGGSLLLVMASLNRKHYQPIMDWVTRSENHAYSAPYDDPLPPIMSVNDDILTIKDASSHKLRVFLLLPILVLVWTFALWRIVDFGPSNYLIRDANATLEELEQGITPDKSRYLSIISRTSINPRILTYEGYVFSRKRRGEDIEALLKNDQRSIDFYRVLISDNGTSSPIRYIKAINSHGTESEKEWLKETMRFNAAYFLFAIIISAAILSIPRRAYLHFDRKKGIVYTWHLGKISACSFQSLGYRYINFHGGFFCLLGEKSWPPGSFKPRAFGLEATSTRHVNSEQGNQNFLLAQIVDFMKYGKQAIITGETFEREAPKTYLFISKKPKHFEQRLERILSKEHELPAIYKAKKL
ncbi:hypothetical protein KIV40_15095 [Vibrio sp. D173a]|uniref:hypothetical protein n=1 Tax=Vibrio sp. D173a TaxID=2836349 RepID=UPI0025579725|nr:hypothetical protein [Vibrio sp. D173a]MDK9756696.1 hypothetical protein [Vibrio sp. D173a]